MYANTWSLIDCAKASPTKSLCCLPDVANACWKYILFHQPADPVRSPFGFDS